MKKIFALFGIVMLTASLSACNTFRGMGEDIERGGEKVQGTATDTQKKM